MTAHQGAEVLDTEAGHSQALVHGVVADGFERVRLACAQGHPLPPL
jgi:hypothetical protein